MGTQVGKGDGGGDWGLKKLTFYTPQGVSFDVSRNNLFYILFLLMFMLIFFTFYFFF